MWVLRFGRACGTIPGTRAAQLRGLALGEAFPPVGPLHVVGDEPAVDLESHHRVTLPELPRDEFDRDTSPEVLDRPRVTAVVEPERGQLKRETALGLLIMLGWGGRMYPLVLLIKSAARRATPALDAKRRGRGALPPMPRPPRHTPRADRAPGNPSP
jgi:hypothetical protein